MNKFSEGDLVKIINNKPLNGNDKAPPCEVGETYVIKEIILDKDENQHLDLGIVSKLSYVRSYETKEELDRGENIHWVHPSRVELVF